ncbi:MAG TPA: Rrf2 family transcriptional regulator [Sedimenticola sp.]|nr:Rrf2 family transcriptional regulator [Sedimenticola sp.]
MRLTTKGRYAVTAMLDLALHHEKGPITLAAIAERQGISLSYLEQLFSRMRKKGLVFSVRGPGGGYSPARPSSEISVAEIITAVDESVDTTRCNGAHNCQNNELCLTHNLWEDLSNRIYDHLKNVSLQSLMVNQNVQQVAQRQDRRCSEVAVELPMMPG